MHQAYPGIADAPHTMNARSLLLIVLLLPGLLLPSGSAMSFCLCAPARGDVDACAGMACCEERIAEPAGAAAWKAVEPCAGCKSIEAPRSQAPVVLPTVPLAWIDPPPCVVQDSRAPEPSNGTVRSTARATATGPPPDRASIPLRI